MRSFRRMIPPQLPLVALHFQRRFWYRFYGDDFSDDRCGSFLVAIVDDDNNGILSSQLLSLVVVLVLLIKW